MTAVFRVRGPRSPLLLLLSALVVLASFAAPRRAHAQGLVVNLPWLGPTAYTFTNTTLATFRVNNFDYNQFDDGFLAFTERYDSALTAGPWRMQLRIDAFVPLFNRTIPTICQYPWCVDYLRADARIERFSLRYQRNGVIAEIGDVYTVIGRGIAVAFRKVDPLGLDNALRGGRVELDLHRFMVRAFGGYANPQNLDPITLQANHDWGNSIAPDPNGNSTLRPGPDLLAGAEAVLRLGRDDDLELGAQALRLHAGDSQTVDYDVDVGGYRIQAPALFDGRMSVHIEVDGLRRYTTYYALPPGGAMTGHGAATRTALEYGRAVFGALQLNLGHWNFLAEWKDYDNYLLSPNGQANDLRRVYSSAPSLERDDVILRSNASTRGGRLRATYLLPDSPWSVAVTALVIGQGEAPTDDPWGPQAYGAAHGYITVRRRARGSSTIANPNTPVAVPSGASPTGGALAMAAGAAGSLGAGTRVPSGDWQLTASAGYRYEWTLGDPSVVHALGMGDVLTSSMDWVTYHADADLAFALSPTDSLEIKVDGRFEHRYIGGSFVDYTRDGIAVTWAHGERLSIGATLRYDTFYSSQHTPWPTIQFMQNGQAIASTEVDSQYPEWYPAGEIRYMFYPGSTLRLFGGMTPGGRLCFNGVCRDVPAFQGAYLELVVRF